MVLLHELVRVLLQIEELGVLHTRLGDLVLGQFPVTFLDATRTGSLPPPQ